MREKKNFLKHLPYLDRVFQYFENLEDFRKLYLFIHFVKEYQQTGVIRKERKERFDKTSIEVINRIKDFYLSPGVSRSMTGPRNMMKVKGVEDDIQRFVLLHTIEEAHQLFVRETGIEIGISTFFNATLMTKK